MAIEEGQVKGLGRFEIVVAELVDGVIFQVKEVVVDVERNQPSAALFEGIFQLDRRRRLAGRAGDGDDVGEAVGVEIAGGDVRVEMSNDTDANLIIADAIRWSPSSGNDKEVASR